jgi:3,4-dihydroxy 2-butanone 4-phosphate synthase/GTP cyclohydrolase II
MDSIKKVISDLKQGKMVVLFDGEDRENEGDLVIAAQYVKPEHIAFMAQYGRGLICVPLTEKRAEELQLPVMVEDNTAPLKCNFTVSVDAKRNVTTGISAKDRAITIKALLNAKNKPSDLVRPGHVFPLIAKEGGVLVRSGHTEGALDLMKLAGLHDVAVICEIMGDDGEMLAGKNLVNFAKKHGMSYTTIKDIIKHRREAEQLVKRAVETDLQTEYGKFRVIVYQTKVDDKEHIAFVMGHLSKKRPTLVRVHSECITSEVFKSKACDCSRQLDQAFKQIVKAREGIFLYMRQEGRGLGLVNKLRAYSLQNEGYDTIEANEKLGFPADLREYGIGAQILADLGVKDMRLMTNNPKKIVGLEGYGLRVVERVPIELKSRSAREHKYLMAKKMKLGHLLKKV